MIRRQGYGEARPRPAEHVDEPPGPGSFEIVHLLRGLPRSPPCEAQLFAETPFAFGVGRTRACPLGDMIAAQCIDSLAVLAF